MTPPLTHNRVVTAFTPGPWEKIGDSGFTNARIKAPTRRHVAKVYAASAAADPVCEANAHLIAAAPELYEALEYARESLGSPVPIGRRHVARKIDAALAKARGE